MKRVIVTTLPVSEGCDWQDLACKIGGNWIRLTDNYARAMGFTVIELECQQATLNQVETALANNKDCLFTGVGHGNKNIFTGYQQSPLIQENVNEHVLLGRPWYGLSCLIGASLGKAVVRKDCPAFCGWDAEFTFMADKNEPDGGKPAQGFRDAVNRFTSTLIEGGDFDGAYKVAQEIFDYWFEQETDSEIRKWLNWDKIHQVCPATSLEYGNGGIRITEIAPPTPEKQFEIDFYLEKSTPPEPETYHVFGHVYDKAEPHPPIEGATVNLVAMIERTTDREGYFSFSGIEPGEYDAKISRDGYNPIIVHLPLPVTEKEKV